MEEIENQSESENEGSDAEGYLVESPQLELNDPAEDISGQSTNKAELNGPKSTEESPDEIGQIKNGPEPGESSPGESRQLNLKDQKIPGESFPSESLQLDLNDSRIHGESSTDESPQPNLKGLTPVEDSPGDESPQLDFNGSAPVESIPGESRLQLDSNDPERPAEGLSAQSTNKINLNSQEPAEGIPGESVQLNDREAADLNNPESQPEDEEDEDEEIDVLYANSNEASEISSYGENSEGESVELDIDFLRMHSTATATTATTATTEDDRKETRESEPESTNMSVETHHKFRPKGRKKHKKLRKPKKERKVVIKKPVSRPNHQKAGSAFVEQVEGQLKKLRKSRKKELKFQVGDPFEPISVLQKFKFLDNNNVQDLVNHLAKIILVWPENLPGYSESRPDPRRKMYPESYFTTSPKEKAVLLHAENFRRQYEFKFPYRRPLVIAPRNEVGVQKLFPTYLSPSVSGYSELFDARTCAQFFKDFLIPEIIVPHTNMPPFIRSHVTLVRDRMANSYEFSIMIASFLLGAGYDAFVVDGYASKEMTTLCVMTEYVDPEPKREINFQEAIKGYDDIIPTRGTDDPNENELVENESLKQIEDELIVQPFLSKYKIKKVDPPKSRYEKKMHERYEAKQLKENDAKLREFVEERVRHSKPPTPDPLQGLRIHSWVLLLPGSRDVEEPIFIDPYSAKFMSPHDTQFHGIEAVFNSKNYYINLQEMWSGSKHFSFDLEDPSKWSKLLVEPEDKLRNRVSQLSLNEMDEDSDRMSMKSDRSTKSYKDPGSGVGSIASSRKGVSLDDYEDIPYIPEKYLEFPTSWTPTIRISHEDYRKKFPQGKKIFEYQNAVVELTAPFTSPDGRVKKIIKFTEPTRNIRKIKYIDERFSHRHDKLLRRLWIRRGRLVHEFFDKGRHDSLKEHIHVAGQNNPEEPRKLLYYAATHPQNVCYREVLPRSLIERFEKRQDFLNYRFTAFDGIICDTIPKGKSKTVQLKVIVDILKDERTGLPGGKDLNIPKRKILRIIEKYERNFQKEPNLDVAEKHMLLDEERIRAYFHFGEINITRNSLEFFKPRPISRFDRNLNAQDEFRAIDSMEYRADALTMPMSLYKRLLILKQLEKDQIYSSNRSWMAMQDIYKSVKLRIQEDFNPVLNKNFFKFTRSRQRSRNTTGSGGSSGSGSGSSSYLDDDSDSEEELDFITPYLYKYGLPKNRQKEVNLKMKIASDFRKRILNKAKKIENDYKQESELLKVRMEWFDANKDKVNQAKEDDFNSFYKNRLARMNVIERRLGRVKERAPINYYYLLLSIVKHPQLNRFAQDPPPKHPPKPPVVPVTSKDLGFVQRGGIFQKCPNYFYQWMDKTKKIEEFRNLKKSEEETSPATEDSDPEEDQFEDPDVISGDFSEYSEAEIAEYEL